MCGIARFVPAPRVAVPLTLDPRRMTSRMHNRGTGAKLVWPEEGEVMGHCLLAILADGKFVVRGEGPAALSSLPLLSAPGTDWGRKVTEETSGCK
jgi:asparagine synthetase B (glutamine-hydrolysing)